MDHITQFYFQLYFQEWVGGGLNWSLQYQITRVQIIVKCIGLISVYVKVNNYQFIFLLQVLCTAERKLCQNILNMIESIYVIILDCVESIYLIILDCVININQIGIPEDIRLSNHILGLENTRTHFACQHHLDPGLAALLFGFRPLQSQYLDLQVQNLNMNFKLAFVF